MTVRARLRPTPLRSASGLLAVLLGALLLVTACGGSASDTPAVGASGEGRTLTVVASTNVWGDVVSRIAGPGVEVRSILSDPAADPHSYESTPSDAAAISDADLVVYNGGGYDEWVARILDTDPSLRDRSVEAFALRGDQADENEHVWFDPTAVKGVVAQVVERLGAVEPAQADALRSRGAAFGAEVDGQATRLADIGRARPGARVVSTEPIAHYLLTTAGVADVTPPDFVEAVENENDPSAASLVTTSDLLTTRQVGALLFNPQTETPVTDRVRSAAQGAGLPVVDVTETLPAGLDYLTWTDGVRASLARALGAPA